MGRRRPYALLERAAASPHLDLAGLHAHQLCRCTHAEQFAALAERMADLAAAFATAHGTRLRVINLGGGLEARNLAVWGTDLPDMGILQTGRAEITFSRPQQRAMLPAVHGIDLA